MNRSSAERRAAFSLVELVIVIVIIGIIAAIAVPRFSRATENANSSAVRGSLAIMRNALELYHAEVGAWPATDELWALTDTADCSGGGTCGPYLRAEVANPLNGGSTAFVDADTSCDTDKGWVYAGTGELRACEGAAVFAE